MHLPSNVSDTVAAAAPRFTIDVDRRGAAHASCDDEPLAHLTYEYLGIDPCVFYAGKFTAGEVLLGNPASRFDIERARARFLAEHLRGGRVLDLGCGSGPYGRMLKEHCGVAELIGLDLDPACVAIAKRSYDDACVFELERRLPFPDHYFDAVFSVDFFGHVEFRHKNALIAEVARVTRPGGLSVHAIESGEIDYVHVDPSNPDDPVMRYVRQEGHVGIEPGSCIRRRWQRFFEDVNVEISFLHPLTPLCAFTTGDGRWNAEFSSLVGRFSAKERRAASICLGFIGDYLKAAIRRFDPELLTPCAAAELAAGSASAELLVWRLFHAEGGLVYLTCRKGGRAAPLSTDAGPRISLPATPRATASPTSNGEARKSLPPRGPATMCSQVYKSFWATDLARVETMKPRNAIGRIKRKAQDLRGRLKHRAEARAAVGVIAADSSGSRGYDVICLPVMPWNSRVQRPQQLTRQFAEHGHRVYYASLGFHAGAAAVVDPVAAGVFETALPGTPGTNVYGQLPSNADVEKMAAAVDRLRVDHRITSAVVVVQLPFWTALAEELRERFGWPIVYDCMDDHSGFSTNRQPMLRAEDRIIASADLVVATSGVLLEKVRSRARRTALIRNACDYEHFAQIPTPLSHLAEGTYYCPPPSPTIGFYGAIAEWFDADLVTDLAEMRPDWRFELIGSTYTGDVARLEKLSNVTLLGEKPYADLPQLAAGWDCCIIPFKRTALTEATNPVKVYEMLATGKPVVAVDLPELRPMARQGLVAPADDAASFAEAIERALAEDAPRRRDHRRAFAAANTWQGRFRDLDAAVRKLFPPASILVVTYNNLPLNKACLHAIFQQTDYPNYEVIVVDNGSTDGTPQWFCEAARGEPRLQVIYNRENRGFAAANNQALRKARGEFLCLLNNDTLVTHGWLSTLIGHLRKTPGLGLVGPVSNNVGNAAKVPVGYRNVAKMPRWAEAYCRRHDGKTVQVEMLGFFCVVMTKAVYGQVGELDERFGLGCFEDDDYCRRVDAEGYELRFARDAFVHHWLEASFRLLGKDAYLRTYYENQRKFEAKWDAEIAGGCY